MTCTANIWQRDLLRAREACGKRNTEPAGEEGKHLQREAEAKSGAAWTAVAGGDGQWVWIAGTWSGMHWT